MHKYINIMIYIYIPKEKRGRACETNNLGFSHISCTSNQGKRHSYLSICPVTPPVLSRTPTQQLVGMPQRGGHVEVEKTCGKRLPSQGIAVPSSGHDSGALLRNQE